jgi:hypothetical protein
MAHYRIIDLKTGAFDVLPLGEAASLAMLDPDVIAWAIEEHGVCETDCHQITEYEFLQENGRIDLQTLPALPSLEEFEAWLAER